MSTPQGPDRYGADRDPEQAGAPAWGTPPPGGWGGHPDAGPPTGAWDPATDEYGDRAWADGGRDDRSWDDRGWDDGGWDDRGYGDPGYGDPGYDDAGPGGYGGRRRAEDRDPGRGAPADAPWGDQPDHDRAPAYPPAYDDRPTPEPGAYDPDRTAAWGADPQAGGYAPGDEPWAPRDEVRRPRRGPFGLGAGALAGIGAGVLVVVVLAVLLFLTPGWAVTRTLDKTALQNGVTQILTQNYGLQVGAVECPDDVAVAADTGFACQALVDGEPVTVPGKVTSDEGDYQVSRV